ncbi:MAG: hypothetical protein Q9218_005676, partial [Villophora microphyllina]
MSVTPEEEIQLSDDIVQQGASSPGGLPDDRLATSESAPGEGIDGDIPEERPDLDESLNSERLKAQSTIGELSDDEEPFDKTPCQKPTINKSRPDFPPTSPLSTRMEDTNPGVSESIDTGKMWYALKDKEKRHWLNEAHDSDEFYP